MDVIRSLQISALSQKLTLFRQSIHTITWIVVNLYKICLINILTIAFWQTKCRNVSLQLPILIVLCLSTPHQDDLGWYDN